MAEPIDDDSKKKLSSVLEMKSMDEFFTLASMSNKKFEAERANNVVMINENQIIDPKAQEKKFLEGFYSSSSTKTLNMSLRIPRKPKWTKDMKKEHLQSLENVFTSRHQHRLPSLSGERL